MEEGSDHYTRTNNLLEAVVDAVTPSIFYSALWECVATNATIRLPALTFWVAGMDEQLYLLGTDIDIESMLATLLRRDMSLSRRLFSWLLESEFNLALLPSSPSIVMIDQASRYILTYSADLVVQAVAMVMEQAFPLPGSQKVLDMKPFRIITEAVFVTMEPLLTQEQMSLVTARTGTVQKIAETLWTSFVST